jgi:hypothetical protein
MIAGPGLPHVLYVKCWTCDGHVLLDLELGQVGDDAGVSVEPLTALPMLGGGDPESRTVLCPCCLAHAARLRIGGVKADLDLLHDMNRLAQQRSEERGGYAAALVDVELLALYEGMEDARDEKILASRHAYAERKHGGAPLRPRSSSASPGPGSPSGPGGGRNPATSADKEWRRGTMSPTASTTSRSAPASSTSSEPDEE